MSIRADEVAEADVRTRLEQAIVTLRRVDADLFAAGASERSLTHRLACHLTALFPDWHVDCEYNRRHTGPKRLLHLRELFRNKRIEPDDDDGPTVFPDVIVHHRGAKNNLLVVEAKKHSSPDQERDREKLKRYLLDPRLRYRFGAFVLFYTGRGAHHTEWNWYSREKLRDRDNRVEMWRLRTRGRTL